jgi:predicted nucleic acid-binding protein
VPAEVFVDTSAWYPLLLRKHPDHARLAAQLRTLVKRGQRVVTTNLIVAETHALVMRRVGADSALTFVQTVRQPPNVVVHSTADLETTAVHSWLERYGDHDFSFTDAVSFAVMTERGIDAAMTLDHHFEVAGFRMLAVVK